MAHEQPPATLTELRDIHDPFERERRLVHTPWHWGAPQYAGLKTGHGAVVHEACKPLAERLAWLRPRAEAVAVAAGLEASALDAFFDWVVQPGVIDELGARGMHPVGPQIVATSKEIRIDDQPQSVLMAMPKGHSSRRVELPGAFELCTGVFLFPWPTHGLVILSVDLKPRFLSADPARLVEVLDLQIDPEPTPAWFQELFGDAEPTDPLRRLFLEHLSQQTEASTDALRDAFVARGWSYHAEQLPQKVVEGCT